MAKRILFCSVGDVPDFFLSNTQFDSFLIGVGVCFLYKQKWGRWRKRKRPTRLGLQYGERVKKIPKRIPPHQNPYLDWGLLRLLFTFFKDKYTQSNNMINIMPNLALKWSTCHTISWFLCIQINLPSALHFKGLTSKWRVSSKSIDIRKTVKQQKHSRFKSHQ